jgi:hypothetical protein
MSVFPYVFELKLFLRLSDALWEVTTKFDIFLN